MSEYGFDNININSNHNHRIARTQLRSDDFGALSKTNYSNFKIRFVISWIKMTAKLNSICNFSHIK